MNSIYEVRILIVDDNKDLLRLLCEQLSGAGYRHIQTAANCAAAKKLFAAEIPELMILDINLPDGDGFSLFRALHAKADVPALFLSARDADADRLFGLGLGADDYLTKPFLMQELLLRVQHILLRTYRAELARTKSKDLKLADRSVDLNDALVTLSNGDTIPLTATELALLRKLADNRGHIVTYDSLCSAVWGADYYGYENSLGVHIRHLRQKLEQDPNQPRCLLTVRGIGYKLAKEELDNHYSSSDIASFSRWYLDDYPVFCWSEDYGLFVAGLTKGSLWKYNLYNSPNVLQDIVHGIPLVILGMLLLVLIFCLWIGWRGTKRLRIVAEGLDALADGQTVQLPTDGFTGELAQKLNQTSSHLQKRNEMLVRRDDTRTQWIAGVSHDVRTPLALILGWGEQLEQDSSLPDTVRHKAAGIRTQCKKLRSLIDDLNLTSKLEYGAQPLRKETFTAGPLFRELVAQFYDSPLAENCEITLNQTNAAEHAQISVDRALLARLLENLLSNSVRHNSESVKICIETEIRENFLYLTVIDNGKGYPPEILAALNLQETTENTPHILGLHVVEQIAAAHGGKSIFESNYPSGARTCVWLPLG